MKKITSNLPSAFTLFFSLILVWVFVVLLFFAEPFSLYYKTYIPVHNGLIFLCSLVFIGLLLLFSTTFLKKIKTIPPPWLFIYFVLLLVFQYIICKNTWFYPGWDAKACYETSMQIANGIVHDPAYFKLCPNNAPITVLLSFPLWIANKLNFAEPYVVLPYLGMVLQHLTCVFLILSLQKLVKNSATILIALFIMPIFIGLSGYMTIPYTDAYSVMFPTLALYLWLSIKKPVLKWFLLSLICFFGATIKPAIAILFIALFIGLLFKGINSNLPLKDKCKKSIIILLAIIVGFIPSQIWKEQSVLFMAGEANPGIQLSESHYIMMGMNSKTFGGHDYNDVLFTSSILDLSEKRSANLKTAYQRLTERSLRENAKFFAVKLFKAYGDGTFGYSYSVFNEKTPPRESALSSFLNNVYLRDGIYFGKYTSFMQMIWLGILLLCLIASVALRKNKTVQLLTLTLLGLTIYLLMVEVWTRYLFVMASFYLLLALIGFDYLTTRINNKKKEVKL